MPAHADAARRAGVDQVATLSLLRHVLAAGASMPVMVLGTYRDSDLSRDHPLTALLADLHREQGVERIKLTGLDTEDVLALMESAAGHELDEQGRALAGEITRETAGNPFFAGEVLRHLTESGAIAQQDTGRWRLVGNLGELGLPQSVREVIGRRVERLGPDARTALSAAAVIGREFDLELLLAIVELPEERLLDLLDEAVAASLLRESAEQTERFTFTHGLVEHTLYEDLGRARRARIHRRVAEALEELCGDEPGERLGELAGHWAAAVVSADRVKAIHYARLAAERALEQLAPDEAVRWYRQALELHDLGTAGDSAERCELLIGLGDAQRQVGNAEFRRTLLDAAALAQELGDADRQCRAVLANSRGWTSQAGAVDVSRVRALEAAADVLSDNDPRRARVLAELASELHQAGDAARCRALVAEALEIARVGGDQVALAHTLLLSAFAIWTPDMLQERQRLVDEQLGLTERLGDPSLRFRVALGAMSFGVEAGERSRVDSSLATMRELAASVPEPSLMFSWMMTESAVAFVHGELATSEQQALRGLEEGTASGQPDAVAVFGAILFQLRFFQGRCGELLEQMVQLADQPDGVAAWRAYAALTVVEVGRVEEARARALAEDLRAVPWDWIWPLVIFAWSEVCARLGLRDRCEELYELVAPYAGQMAICGSVIMGSFDWALGTLALALERYDQAEVHFTAGAELEERLGAPLFLARSRVGRARALIARGQLEDLKRAEQMLEQAEEAAERLSGGLVTREAAECRVSLAAISR